jgi:hypothetical protein
MRRQRLDRGVRLSGASRGGLRRLLGGARGRNEQYQ